MSSPGYIYVLINPSFNELVKIGKTQREPEERIKELSSATGVPTPFVLAYKAYFQDCSKAETYIHSQLKQKGYRVTDNREFFKAPLHEVIDVVINAKDVLKGTLSPSSTTDLNNMTLDNQSSNLFDDSQIEPCRAVYELADNYYLGFDDTLQDYKEALDLYIKSANLGCKNAFWKIGIMHMAGEGVNQNNSKALDNFKIGVQNGDNRCWAEMAVLFYKENKYENMRKCWRKYFESEHYRLNITYGDRYYNNVWYAIQYLVRIFALIETNFSDYGIENKNHLLPITEMIIEMLKKVIEQLSNNPKTVDGSTHKMYIKILKEVQKWI